MILIPSQQDKKFSQKNSGDFFGNILQSKNVTFWRNGYISLEKRTRNLFDSGTAAYADLVASAGQNIQKFCKHGSKIWMIGTKNLFYLDFDFVLTKDATASTPTLSTSGNDIMHFEKSDGTELLIVANSAASSVDYYNGSVWATLNGLTVGLGRVLANFENLRCFAVAGGNVVQLVDATLTPSTVLTLPKNFVVNSMDWNDNKLAIGVVDILGGDGGIFEWDGKSIAWNYFWREKGQVLSVVAYDIGFAYVTSVGLLKYLGASTKVLAPFPIYDTDKQWSSDVNFAGWVTRVVHGGMAVDRDMIYIGVDASFQSSSLDVTREYFENDFPSGVWCFDPNVGLYHRYSVGGSPRTATGAVTTANVNTTTDVITIPSAIAPVTGTPVFYEDGSSGGGTWIGGIKYNTRYFVIKLSSTTLQLAATYADAIAGTPVPINLTSTGNNAQFLVFTPNGDFGGIYQRVTGVYLLRVNGNSSVPVNSFASRLLIGSIIAKTGTSFNVTAIHSVEYHQENRGYVILPRIPSGESTLGNFAKMVFKFRPLVNPEDKIILKARKFNANLYQTRLRLTVSTTGTWVTSTTFTTNNITDLEIGYEVEIVTGSGCGYIAHITNISDISGGVYTITIDETVQNIVAAETFFYVASEWKKADTIISVNSTTNVDGFADINVPGGTRATDMEFKVEIRGKDVLIEEIQIVERTQQPTN